MFILAGVLLAGIGGFIVFRQLQYKNSVSFRQLIPDNAFFVAEIRKPWEVLNQKSGAWQDFLEISNFNHIVTDIQKIAESDKDIQEFLKNQQIVISFHGNSPKESGEIYYVALENSLIDKLLKRYRSDPNYQVDSRTFQKVKITEVINRNNSRQIFSYIIHQNYLIGSFSSLLLEDNIRHLQDGNFFSFQDAIQPELPENNSSVLIYCNGNGAGRFINQFLKESKSGLSDIFKQGVFQIEQSENQLVMFGNCQTIEKDIEYLDIFEKQQPQPLLATHLIPNNTGILYHLGFSDASLFLHELNNFWQKKMPAFHNSRKVFSTKYNLNLDTTGHFIKNEMIVGQIEGNSGEENRYLLIKTKNGSEATGFFEDLAKQIDIEQNTSPFIENYGGLYIRQIHFKDFPLLWLGEPASGFEECFFTEIEGYILMASNLPTLKNIIDNISQGYVWKNNDRKKEFLSKISENVNFSILLETSHAWTFLPESVQSVWQTNLLNKAENWKNFHQIAVQLQKAGNNNFQTSLVAFHQKSKTAENVLGKFYPVFSAKLDTTFQGKTFLVKNLAENTYYVLAQDKAYLLYCFDKNGKKIFKSSLNHPLEAAIEGVDFYKNNKPAFVVAAHNDFYIFNNKGEQVQNFPVSVPSDNFLQTLSVIDYDKNKDYRFMLTDKTGNLFLYNKAGKLLEGWNPKSAGFWFSAPVKHQRIGGKDYIFGMQANGTFQVWNRKGQVVSPFPLKTGERINSGVFIKSSALPQETLFSTISEEGQLIQFNLAGAITNKKQFIRTSRESVFQLCIEQNEKDFFIVRQDLNNVTVLDKNTNVILSKELDNIRKNSVVQFYDFGGDVKIFFITQPDLGKTFVFDYTGKPIGDSFENKSPVSVLYVSDLNKLLIVRAKEREVGVVSVKIK